MADTWGRRLFTAGAIVLILLAMAHSISLFEPIQASNDTERQLLSLMRTYKFDLVGSPRSMDNLLRGFSICFMVAAVGLGVLDLVLSRERSALEGGVALVNALWLAVMTDVSLCYFFIIPTTFMIVALLLFALTWLVLRCSAS